MSEGIVIAGITVLGVVFTAIVAFFNFNKNIKIEQITFKLNFNHSIIFCILIIDFTSL